MKRKLIFASIALAMLVGGFSWGDGLVSGLSDGGFF